MQLVIKIFKMKMSFLRLPFNQSYIRSITLIAWLLISLFSPPTYSQITQAYKPSEYEVRAAYMYNFIRFVNWPEEVFSDSLEPIVIGIIGQDPFGKILDAMIEGRTIQSRRIVIKRFQRLEDYYPCHALYIGFKEKRYQVAILKLLEGTPVLTIGDLDGFIRLGGMINFIVASNQVSFEVNLKQVERSRLEVSAKLLKLVKIIRY